MGWGKRGEEDGSGANVLRSEADDAAGDVERVFARNEHASQVVQRRVRVAAAHRLGEGGENGAIKLKDG